MNVLMVLGLAIVGYFIFVGLWLTKVEDYLHVEQPGVTGGDSDAR